MIRVICAICVTITSDRAGLKSVLSVKSVGKRKAAKTICGISEICVEFGLEAKTPPKVW